MPEDLSPEEKLLRLIKGGQNKPDSAPNHSVPEPVGKRNVEEPQKEPQPVNDDMPADGKEPQKPINPHKKLPVFFEDIKIDGKLDKNQPEQQPNTIGDNTTTDGLTAPIQQPIKTNEAKPPKKIEIATPTSAPLKESVTKTNQPHVAGADNKQTNVAKKSKLILIKKAFLWVIYGFNFWNILFLLLLCASVGATVWHVNYAPTTATRVTGIADIKTADKDKKTDDGKTAKPKPFPYFAEELEKKNLFKLVSPPPPPPPPEPEKKEPEKPKVKIETLTQNLVLQGIVYDIGPPQAIIYDKKSNKTLFVGNNTKIDDVKVKEIKRSKVILQYEDQTQELSF